MLDETFFKKYAVAKFFYSAISHDFVSFLSVFIVVLNFEFCLCLVRPRQSGSLAVAKAGPMAGRFPARWQTAQAGAPKF
jgi:hypothetical protein